MDLKQLRTFRAVAELGSLSKAAERLREDDHADSCLFRRRFAGVR